MKGFSHHFNWPILHSASIWKNVRRAATVDHSVHSEPVNGTAAADCKAERRCCAEHEW